MAELNATDSAVKPSSHPDSATGKATVEHESPDRLSKDDNIGDLEYPPPWRWENYFPGGYTPKRMMKIRNPKNMYRAINLFAGLAIM